MSEEKFIKQLINQDYAAYSQLIDQYQQKIFGRCMSFVPNIEDAEDIAQEVFIEVFKSIKKFKGNAKLSTWIYKITTTKCLEFIRKKNTKKRFGYMQVLKGKSFDVDKTNFYTDFKHPGVLLEDKENAAQLFKAISQLSKDQKTVYTLNKIEGLSYKEIAEETGKTIGSIESLLFRAKKNLKTILENYYKNDM